MIKRLTIAEVARAMELRDAGLYWHFIAARFHISENGLYQIIKKARQHGFAAWAKAASTNQPTELIALRQQLLELRGWAQNAAEELQEIINDEADSGSNLLPNVVDLLEQHRKITRRMFGG